MKADESLTKLRGGYYTPQKVASYLLRWAIQKQPTSVLEPSCGDGAFIRAALDQSIPDGLRLTAVERLASEALKARRVARNHPLLDADVLIEDFLEWCLGELQCHRQFDAVVGNPPYIRYQYLEEQDQKYAEGIFKYFGLTFTKHTNAWVPFVVASVGLLASGGRLAMVIPSEILHVLHATSLREFLLKECSRVLLIDPVELLFDGALQGTVLLMAEKKELSSSRSQGVSVISVPDKSFLVEDPEEVFRKANFVAGEHLNGKWMKVLLSSEALDTIEGLTQSEHFAYFRDLASVEVGIVTGANKFFLVSDEVVTAYSLEDYVHPMFGRSEHCPGVVYDHATHEANREMGLATNFVNLPSVALDQLQPGAQAYVRFGEEQGLHKRYKTRIRQPWYAVPSVHTSTVGMLKRCHNFPRLIHNPASAFTTDTAYRVTPKANSLSPETLVHNFVNSVTALTAELEGRHYGGGVLEQVPSEIRKLIVPTISTNGESLLTLDRRVRLIDKADELLDLQDDVVLRGTGLTKCERDVIHEAWRGLRMRRQRTAKKSAGEIR
jgi:adenine-specific DNA-methyltransferase